MAKEGEYDLEVLLKLRRDKREEAEAIYAEALTAYHHAGQRVRSCEESHRSLVEERRRKCMEFDDKIAKEAGQMADIQRFDLHIRGLRDREQQILGEVEVARKEQHRTQKLMRKAHDEMLEAIKALKAVEKHHMNWMKEEQIQQRRREAVRSDDVAARIWREQHG